MVTKRIRSEYMKKFKDPKWETYAKCYEDLVKYRLSRRLLEQAHSPWFWDESGSDTESSGESTPQHRRTVEPVQLQEQSEPEATVEQPEQQTAEAVNTEGSDAREAETSHIREQVTEDIEPQEKEEEKSRNVSRTAALIHSQTDPRVQNNTKRKTHYTQKPARPKAKHTITKDTDKGSRHPFALYGSGERQADMASKRTHNVSAGASTKEIHESALRAKTRREVEKRIKKVGKERAKSADQENLTRTKPFPDYNPWMTEYMRCFSARSQ
ncbi:centriole, cilia and spindle-associated protein [Trichomycterus rosablanca]|uniref:centriole, cilia and spindle-associated protein n=1 Tax=Trichomycterus rosablanca TaxID=2290929 RepID=UPI002F358D07